MNRLFAHVSREGTIDACRVCQGNTWWFDPSESDFVDHIERAVPVFTVEQGQDVFIPGDGPDTARMVCAQCGFARLWSTLVIERLVELTNPDTGSED